MGSTSLPAVTKEEEEPCLSLVVGGVALSAAAALDQGGLGALSHRQGAVVDPLLDERLPLLLHLVAGHLCRGHHC